MYVCSPRSFKKLQTTTLADGIQTATSSVNQECCYVTSVNCTQRFRHKSDAGPSNNAADLIVQDRRTLNNILSVFATCACTFAAVAEKDNVSSSSLELRTR